MNAMPDADDQRIIDQVLTDLDSESASDLRPLLAELRSLAHGEPVEPGPLAALLLAAPEASAAQAPAAEAPATDAPTAVLRAVPGTGPGRTARPFRRRRPLAAAAILAAAAVGAGAAAAAADEGFRSSVNEGISTIVGVLGGHTEPKPAPISSVSTSGSLPAAPAPTSPAPSPSQDASSSATERPTAPDPTAHPSPSSTRPGALPQLPSPNLGVPVPSLPSIPGNLPTTPPVPTGQLPGGVR